MQNNDEMQKNGEIKKSSGVQKNILFFLTGVLLIFMYSNYEAEKQEKLKKLKVIDQQHKKAMQEYEKTLEEFKKDPAVELVMKGTIKGYEKTTISKAFNASFDDFKWDKVEGKKGEILVQFTGKISQEMHDYLIAKISSFFDFEKIGLDTYGEYSYYLNRALYALGGGGNWRESDYVKNLNKKYGCSFIEDFHTYTGYRVDYYRLVSEDSEGARQYYVEMFEDLKALLWKVGETVKVQWLVYPNGYQFEFYACETNVKGFGVKKDIYQELLEAIYN